MRDQDRHVNRIAASRIDGVAIVTMTGNGNGNGVRATDEGDGLTRA